jgi:hypothetical protein
MKRLATLPVLALVWLMCSADSCDSPPSSDQTQSQAQEQILKEGTQSVGMPAIKNFNERRLLKMILELRDQAGLTTYTYVWPEMSPKPIFLCDSIGYGIPYATQFTNPQKIAAQYQSGYAVMAQADPNGLFSPAAAEGTWVMCKNPHGTDVTPVYIEPRVIVTQFKL